MFLNNNTLSIHTLAQFLTRFLHSISEKSQLNKMTTSNLAVVITPNVIRASCSVNEGANIKLETQLMETIIQVTSLSVLLEYIHKDKLWKQTMKVYRYSDNSKLHETE